MVAGRQQAVAEERALQRGRSDPNVVPGDALDLTIPGPGGPWRADAAWHRRGIVYRR